jgi:hypothetical protein
LLFVFAPKRSSPQETLTEQTTAATTRPTNNAEAPVVRKAIRALFRFKPAAFISSVVSVLSLSPMRHSHAFLSIFSIVLNRCGCGPEPIGKLLFLEI